jgi:hypothetical protein
VLRPCDRATLLIPSSHPGVLYLSDSLARSATGQEMGEGFSDFQRARHSQVDGRRQATTDSPRALRPCVEGWLPRTTE